MKNTEVIKDILIKIIGLLTVLYLIILGIRISVVNDYSDDLSVLNSVSSNNNGYAIEVATIDTNEYETESFGTLDNLEFIIDVTSVDVYSNTYCGNTATKDGYSGILKFRFSETLVDTISETIYSGRTYIINTSPMMEVDSNGLPIVTATSIKLATDEDINKLEYIKSEVSTFKRKVIEYRSMPLKDIIEDANSSYATWTQDEIKEYLELLEKEGYTDDMEYKSYVCLRGDISRVYAN